jgi:hypothetical protein
LGSKVEAAYNSEDLPEPRGAMQEWSSFFHEDNEQHSFAETELIARAV